MDPELASNLRGFSKENHIMTPMIVGGYVRDLVLTPGLEPADIDLTTNDADVTRLGIGFALKNNLYYKIFSDLHITIYSQQYMNLDFSSNFNSKSAMDFFNTTKFSNQKYHEVISRDFTINTLHKSMFSDEIIDPLNIGLKDCQDKIIKVVSTPEICFGDDPRRVYRAVSIATRFGLKIDENIIDFIRKNHTRFMPTGGGAISETYILSTIDKSMGINDDLLIQLLIDTKLLPFVPLVGKFKDLLIKKNMISSYLDLIKN